MGASATEEGLRLIAKSARWARMPQGLAAIGAKLAGETIEMPTLRARL